MSSEVWSARATAPADVEAALRELLVAHRAERRPDAPARVINLVAIVDREWRGEIENRLERVGRYHASRTILCAVDPRRTTIDARASISDDGDGSGGEFSTLREQVVVDVGERHLRHLDTIVDPLVVTDLPTLLWSPHGHPEAVDALMPLTQSVLLDSDAEPDLEDALARARELAGRAYVVDLAWLRSTPWRERVAGGFDPPDRRSHLATISRVAVRHHPDSGASALLFLGWLASRLGWRPGSLAARRDGLAGRVRSRRGEVSLQLEATPEQSVPGLAGLTIETDQGLTIAFDRGPGGLHARRHTRRGQETEWTILGASRGEAGILGEGIRQALLRDPTYQPALDAASAMVA